EDGSRHRSLFAEDPEEEVLGADVVVEQAVGFFGRKLQHPFGFGAERNLHGRGDLLPEHRAAFDFLPDILEREVGPRKNPAGQSLSLADQPEQQVLGLNRNAPELAGFVASEEEYSSSPFGVPFEHPGYLRESYSV